MYLTFSDGYSAKNIIFDFTAFDGWFLSEELNTANGFPTIQCSDMGAAQQLDWGLFENSTFISGPNPAGQYRYYINVSHIRLELGETDFLLAQENCKVRVLGSVKEWRTFADTPVAHCESLSAEADLSMDVVLVNGEEAFIPYEDTKSTTINFPGGSLDHYVLLLDGAPCAPNCDEIEVQAGDSVTYAVEYSLPFSELKGLNLEAFSPHPVFLLTDVAFADLNNTECFGGEAVFPNASFICIGEEDTFSISVSDPPTYRVSENRNSILFQLAASNLTSSSSSLLQYYYTLEVSGKRFPDELQVTSLAKSVETGCGEHKVANRITVLQPVLRTTTVTTGDDSCAPSGAVTVSAYGSSGYRLSPNQFDSITEVDVGLCSNPAYGGDNRTVVIVVENTGNAPAYQVAIECDMEPIPNASFVLMVLESFQSANVFVTDGQGNPVAFSFGPPSEGYQSSAFGYGSDGYSFNISILENPALDSVRAGSGENMLIVSIDFAIPSDIPFLGEGKCCRYLP